MAPSWRFRQPPRRAFREPNARILEHSDNVIALLINMGVD